MNFLPFPIANWLRGKKRKGEGEFISLSCSSILVNVSHVTYVACWSITVVKSVNLGGIFNHFILVLLELVNSSEVPGDVSQVEYCIALVNNSICVSRCSSYI